MKTGSRENSEPEFVERGNGKESQELREAYAQAGDLGGFQQKLTGFRRRCSNRPAMLGRIEKL
jgi:hypothetical protein